MLLLIINNLITSKKLLLTSVVIRLIGLIENKSSGFLVKKRLKLFEFFYESNVIFLECSMIWGFIKHTL